jgi:hypothetical protein
MTAFAVRTITDAEAADRLGYSLRAPAGDVHVFTPLREMNA